MSVDDQSDAQFESVLGEAITLTGRGFDVEAGPGLDEVVTRGRRLRRRRSAALAGGVAAVTLVAAGGFVAAGLPGRTGSGGPVSVAAGPPTAPSGSGVPSGTGDAPGGGPTRVTVTQEQLIGTLKALLPPGDLSQPAPLGKAGMGTDALTSLVYDDHHGAAAISVELRRQTPNASDSSDRSCPDKAYVPFDDCNATRLPDGSSLLLIKGYEFPDLRVNTKNWSARLLTPDGRRIEFEEWNAPQGKDAPVSRSAPPLDFPQLKALVTDPSWTKLFDGIPQPAPRSTSYGPTWPSGDAILATAARLLPDGLTEGDPHGPQIGFANFTVNDGKGACLVEINVEDWSRMLPGANPGANHGANPGAVPGDNVLTHVFGGVTPLPDGTRVVLDPHADSGDKGGKNIVRMTADALLPDGTRVAVAVTNGPSPRLDATRAKPALTLDQLKAIAISPQWAALRQAGG